MSLLKSLLPVAAGIALSPFLTPMGAAAVVGGVAAIRSKKVYDASTQDALMQGLMAGAGAYGGGKIAQGLGAFGADKTVSTMAPEAAAQTAAQAASPQGMILTNATAAPAAASTAGAGYMPTYSQIGAGTSKLFSSPGSIPGLAQSMNGTPELLKATGLAAIPVVPELMKPSSMPEVPGQGGNVRPYDYEAGTVDPMGPYTGQSYERQWFRPSYTAQPPRPYRHGGMAGVDRPTPVATSAPAPMQAGLGGVPMRQGMFAGSGIASQLSGLVGRPAPFTYQYRPAMQAPAMAPRSTGERVWVRPQLTRTNQRRTGFAEGGRMLSGPGDGVSDHIPAVLDNGQPARLADGEFVVPARDVAELGNGSSAAGARKLYAMLDRLEKSRRQAKRGQDMKPEKHLPA